MDPCIQKKDAGDLNLYENNPGDKTSKSVFMNISDQQHYHLDPDLDHQVVYTFSLNLSFNYRMIIPKQYDVINKQFSREIISMIIIKESLGLSQTPI